MEDLKIVICDRSDEEHCLVEEVFASQMEIAVEMTSIEIRCAMLPSFTSTHFNHDKLSEKEEICAQKNTCRHNSLLSGLIGMILHVYQREHQRQGENSWC